MRNETGAFSGYADVLQGRTPEREGSREYYVGVTLAKKHLLRFGSVTAKPYSQAQALCTESETEFVLRIKKDLQIVRKQAETVNCELVCLEDQLNSADLTNRNVILADKKILKQRLLSLKKEVSALVATLQSPCGDCPALAMCGTLELACISFKRFVNLTDGAAKRLGERRLPRGLSLPSEEIMAEIFPEEGSTQQSRAKSGRNRKTPAEHRAA